MAWTPSIGARIERARAAAGLSRQALAEAVGFSRRALGRIISGERGARVPEVLVIVAATGTTVAALTGIGVVSDRAQCAIHPADMREALLRHLELNAYLDEQAIPAPYDSR